MTSYFLVADVGTHALKAALFTRDIRLLEFSSLALSHGSSFHEDGDGGLSSAFETLARKVCTVLSKQEEKELFIVISGNGPSMICAQKDGNPISFLSWKGAEKQRERQLKKGTRSYFLPQLDRMRDVFPHIYADIAWVLPPAEYIGYLLSGKKNIWVPHDAYVPYVWSEKDIDVYDMKRSCFPQALQSATIIGTADTIFARRIFSQTFPDARNVCLVAGGLDYLSALVGGNIEQGQIFQRSGTSVMLNIVEKRGAGDDERRSYGHKRKFVLPHFFEQYTNIGVPIPYYTEVYTSMRRASTLIPSTRATTISRRAVDDFFVRSDGEKVEDYALKTIPLEKQQDFFREVLFRMVRKAFNEVLREAKKKDYRDTIFVSGGHARDTALMKDYAEKLQLKICIHKPVYCELLGNLCFGLKASGAYGSVATAMHNVRKHTPKTIFVPEAHQ